MIWTHLIHSFVGHVFPLSYQMHLLTSYTNIGLAAMHQINEASKLFLCAFVCHPQLSHLGCYRQIAAALTLLNFFLIMLFLMYSPWFRRVHFLLGLTQFNRLSWFYLSFCLSMTFKSFMYGIDWQQYGVWVVLMCWLLYWHVIKPYFLTIVENLATFLSLLKICARVMECLNFKFSSRVGVLASTPRP